MKAQVMLEIGSFPVPDTVPVLPFTLPPMPARAGVPASAPWGAPTAPEYGNVLGGIPLRELDPIDLERLCDAFRAEVFRKAGKQRPPQDAPAVEGVNLCAFALRNVVSAYDAAPARANDAGLCDAVEAARELVGL